MKLRADEGLPERVRIDAADRFEGRLPGKLFLVGLFSSSRGMIADAQAAADLLGHRYRRGISASFILVVAGMAGRSQAFRNALSRLANAARWPMSRRMRAVQARFDSEFRELFEPGSERRKDSAA